MPRPLQVFLCHASQDKPEVFKLHRNLVRRGVKPWLDQVDLLPGENWEFEIPNALLASDVILVCLSKNSIDKEGYVQKEISFALDKALEKPEGAIFIVPVKLEECDLPKKLARFHAVELFRKDGFNKLLLGLNKRATGIGAEISPITLEESRQRGQKNFINPEVMSQQKLVQNVKAEVAVEQKTMQGTKQVLPRKQEKQKVNVASEQKQKIKPAIFREWQIFIGGIVVLLSLVFGVYYMFQISPPQVTPTVEPINTLVVTVTPKITSIDENLIFVPAGEFRMGSDVSIDETPIHTVNVDAFWIEKTEVTNAMYKICVDAKKCASPNSDGSSTRLSYFWNTEFENYPVINVSWDDAVDYCKFIGKRLPTEAEWEKAARGTNENIYPWITDSDAVLNNLLNYNKKIRDTNNVNSYPKAMSDYGVFNMAGNVWEWVNDWYDDLYYRELHISDPQGPASGEERVIRGGGWDSNISDVRSANRDSRSPVYWGGNLGFRCARSYP